MKRLVEQLQHQLDRSGLAEGREPWIEVNVGQDSQPRVALRNSVVWLQPIEKPLVQHLQKATDLPPGAQFIFSALAVDMPDGPPKRSVMVSAEPPQKNLTDRAMGILAALVKKYQRALGATQNHGVTSKKPGRGNYAL